MYRGRTRRLRVSEVCSVLRSEISRGGPFFGFCSTSGFDARFLATIAALSFLSMSQSPVPLRVELRETVKLSGPIVLSQAGHMSMGLVDTLVAGHISTTALAGLGLAANFYWTFTTVFACALLAFDTYFSQAVGARDERRLLDYLGQSFWSCAAVALISAAFLLAGNFVYLSFAPATPTREAFGIYIKTIIWCLPSL